MDKTQGIDLIRLLRGDYEIEALPEGRPPAETVPDYGYNVLNTRGLLYHPVVDQARLERGGRRPKWPAGAPFAVCLTHDLDELTCFSLRQAIRRRISHYTHRRGNRALQAKSLLGMGWDTFRRMGHLSVRPDPLHRFEAWLKAEEDLGARSTFFVWPGWRHVGKRHITDCPYELSDPVSFRDGVLPLGEMLGLMADQGWEIGLHPSWHSHDDPGEMRRQKDALEEALKREVVSVRQHYLRYDLNVTPYAHDFAGLIYDSTLGFNDNVGFRFGTSYPFRIYDREKEGEGKVWEIPLHIQDGALLSPHKGLRLDEETAMAYIRLVAERVEEVGGVLTVSWHTHAILNASWWRVYGMLLSFLHEKGAWFGTVRQIGAWWEEGGGA